MILQTSLASVKGVVIGDFPGISSTAIGTLQGATVRYHKPV